MRKIGVFGGTFNPVHNGHVHLAQAYRRALGLHLVLFIPTNLPPHKEAQGVAAPAHRLAMCRLALDGQPGMAVSDLEIVRAGRSYTVDTLRALARLYPGDTLYFLMGADMFLTVQEWNGFEDIARLAVLCTASRHEGEMPGLRRHARTLETHGARCHIERIPVLDISSTQVRDAVAAGGDCGALVPVRVAGYINRHGLYRDGTPTDGKGNADDRTV